MHIKNVVVIATDKQSMEDMMHTAQKLNINVEGKKIWNGPIPDNSYEDLGNHVRMSTPEFFFLRKANEVSFLEAVHIGIELCGKHVTKLTMPSIGDEWGFLKQSRTNTLKIREYLAEISDTDAGKNALNVLDYVIDDVSTPFDAYLYMMLHIPKKHGGAGLPMPDVSAAYENDHEFMPPSYGKFLAYDICWRDIRIAIQYVTNADKKDITALFADEMLVFIIDKHTMQDTELLKDTLNNAAMCVTGEKNAITDEILGNFEIPKFDNMQLTFGDLFSHA